MVFSFEKSKMETLILNSLSIENCLKHKIKIHKTKKHLVVLKLDFQNWLGFWIVENICNIR